MAKPILSDDLWARIEPLLPPQGTDRHIQYAGRKPSDPRRVMTGILFVLKTGIPWMNLPATSDFPSGYTCWRMLKKWNEAGVWKKLLESLLAELRAAGKLDLSTAIVDSSSVKAPRGGNKTGPSPVDRRKLGSKHHVITDAEGTPLAIVLTAANCNDITQLVKLIDSIPKIKGRIGRPKNRPSEVIGDRGYDSEPHRKALKKRVSSRT